MAIVNTLLSVMYEGDKKIVFGKSVISGATNTGDITLSTMRLKRVDHIDCTVSDALTSACSANEDFPCTNDITIITTNNADTVYWMAVGVPG